MNDELTPDERAALRSRITSGARGIAPVGAHRNAWIAGGIAAVLVVAIAGGVVATSTLSAPEIATTPTPTATPTMTIAPVVPTPTPTFTPAPLTPAVAFDGDCSQVLSDDEASVHLGGGRAKVLPDERLADNTADSLALLGGMTCSWMNEDGSSMSVVVAAPAAVDPTFQQSMSTLGCPDTGCRMGRVEGDIWVGVSVPSYPTNGKSAGFTPEETRAVTATIQGVISEVASKPHVAPVPSISEVRSGGWTLSDCSALKAVLEDQTGEQLTMDDPDKAIPTRAGVAAELLASSAHVTSCGYRDSALSSRGSIVAELTPGVSIPPAVVREAPYTFETVVEGADHAWGQVAYDHVYAMDLLAVKDDNRLIVRRVTSEAAVTDAEKIAAAVIAFVDQRR